MCTRGKVDMDKNLIITHSEVNIHIKENRQETSLISLSARAHAFESL